MPITAEHRTDPVVDDGRAALLDEWVAVGAEIARLEARRMRMLAERAEMLAYETGPKIVHSSMAQRSMIAARPSRHSARGGSAALRPVTQEQAHREARDEREVSVRPTSDGIAQLIGVIPEVLAYAIFDRLTAAAAAMDDDRTMDQRRADLFCDLLLTAMASTAMGIDLDAIRPTVQVTIAASTLAGRDDAMAELDGVGPIHPDLARSLAGRALSFSRLFLDPDGMVTNVDTYVPSSRMKRYLRARDQHCRFPGCRAKTSRCQIDHNHDRALGGATSLCNLACFCTSHHPLKHPDVDARHRWTVRQQPEGTLVWTSPLGREYIDTPELRVMFI